MIGLYYLNTLEEVQNYGSVLQKTIFNQPVHIRNILRIKEESQNKYS